MDVLVYKFCTDHFFNSTGRSLLSSTACGCLGGLSYLSLRAHSNCHLFVWNTA